MTFHRRSFALLATFLAIAAVAGCRSTTTILVVRHAEKGAGADPDLTTQGEQRARALIPVAERAQVVAIYHTQYKRTKQTVQPLADQLGITPVQVNYTPGQEAAHADAVAQDILDNHAGKTVLVAGHTTTVPAILERLGLSAPPAIPESKYENLFVLIKCGSSIRFIHSEYGP